ncbi:hypothetical protein [Dactylosporangium fulvum]|uniref:Uncharacterized protein n=1 Tax=Dactylosporangium fulvum TaxID=53359 RepID=A0ABY5VRM0_9ACTN|nr:hypothetical protein [Dactylosporangium fulvum]UWP80418.1 hypothetical protein Dfulv_35390 [Dactylosporangium fulvum]
MNEFLHHYVEIMADPAHLAAEVSLMLLVDVLFLGTIWPMLRRVIDRRIGAEHRKIDQGHGADHAEPL